MATRKGTNISGHYVVSINAMICLIIYVPLNSKKMKGRTESYFKLFLKLNDHRHGVLISGYVEVIPTAVSSN